MLDKGGSFVRRWAVVLVFLFSLTVLSCAEKILVFEDDFSGSLDQWQYDSTSWHIDNGALIFPNTDYGNIFAGDENWENYAVEAEILPLKYGEWGSVRLFFRMNKLWFGYGIAFNPDGYTVHRLEGNWNLNLVLKDSASMTFPPGEPIEVRVEVIDNTITIIANDEILFDDEDPDDVYFEGKFGFRADNTAVEIRNVRVYKL